MHVNILKAYEYLTPKDQIVVDAVIISLYEKDIKMSKMAHEVVERLGGKDIQEKTGREKDR